jgi:hypothetical protein
MRPGERSLQDVAQLLGVSRQRISQLVRKYALSWERKMGVSQLRRAHDKGPWPSRNWPRRSDRRKLGICVWHGCKNLSEKGRVHCRVHLDYQNNAHSRHYAAKREAGLCAQWGCERLPLRNKNNENQALCFDHWAQAYTYRRKRRPDARPWARTKERIDGTTQKNKA